MEGLDLGVAAPEKYTTSTYFDHVTSLLGQQDVPSKENAAFWSQRPQAQQLPRFELSEKATRVSSNIMNWAVLTQSGASPNLRRNVRACANLAKGVLGAQRSVERKNSPRGLCDCRRRALRKGTVGDWWRPVFAFYIDLPSETWLLS